MSYILILYIHVNFEYIPYIDCLRFSFFLQPVLIKIKIPSVGFPSIGQQDCFCKALVARG